MILSVVIPTLNETKTGYLPQILDQLAKYNDIEVIIADGGSTDGTPDFASKYTNTRVINIVSDSRASRINAGINAAKGFITLIHHPRTLLENGAIDYLLENHKDITWGGFTHIFDKNHPLLKFTSWYSNQIRGRWGKILYLDHCIFARTKFLKLIGPLPEVDIFEDTILCKYLAKSFGPPTRSNYLAQTSAIRFVQNGLIKQSAMNQFLKLGFHLGLDHKVMNRLYERKTRLNGHHPL